MRPRSPRRDASSTFPRSSGDSSGTTPAPSSRRGRIAAIPSVPRRVETYAADPDPNGRLVIAAAKLGARGVGIDIDPQRIEESRANAKAAGVSDKVEFRLQDALEADVSDATVVTLYLLSSSNAKLRPKLTAQLKPGARIVSHQFGMGDWEPAKVETFTDSNGTSRTLYLWTIR